MPFVDRLETGELVSAQPYKIGFKANRKKSRVLSIAKGTPARSMAYRPGEPWRRSLASRCYVPECRILQAWCASRRYPCRVARRRARRLWPEGIVCRAAGATAEYFKLGSVLGLFCSPTLSRTLNTRSISYRRTTSRSGKTHTERVLLHSISS